MTAQPVPTEWHCNRCGNTEVAQILNESRHAEYGTHWCFVCDMDTTVYFGTALDFDPTTE